jgi:small-conductance mechanosensitive channel/CRP-like cAMP-binding protein
MDLMIRRALYRLALPLGLNLAIAGTCNVLLGAPLGWLAPGRSDYPSWIGNVIPFLQILALGYLLERGIRLVLSRTGTPQLALQLIAAIVYFGAVALSVRIVFDESLGTLLAASGIVGLAVGFAVRGLLADLFSGIVLHLDDSLSIGDWVDVALRGREISGRLRDVQWRAVILADRSGNLVLIPNSEFAAATLTNRSRPQATTEYGGYLRVGSEYDRGRVTQILETALAKVTSDGLILPDPAPYVRIGGLDEGTVIYKMFYWLDPGMTSPPRAQSAVLGTGIDFLKAAGIQLYPIHRTHISRPALPGQDRLSEDVPRQNALSNIPLLASLSHDELNSVVQHAHIRLFSAGTVILRQGDSGDSMMVVSEGCLEVSIQGEAGATMVARLWPGECLGEMSLLTGAPRSATVTAASYVSLLEIGKEGLEPLLRANPLLIERLATTVEKRRREQSTLATRQGEDDKGAVRTLTSKIRSFFGL